MTIVKLVNGNSRLLDLSLVDFVTEKVDIRNASKLKLVSPLGLRTLSKFGSTIARIILELKSREPKIVVLSERDDTMNLLPTLVRELPNCRFVSIQTSWFIESAHLHLWWPGDRRNLKILTWGDYQIEQACLQGRDIRGRYAVGALEASLFCKYFDSSFVPGNSEYICVFAKRKFGKSQKKTFMDIERRKNVEQMLKYVDRLCAESGLKAIIPTDYRRTEDEFIADVKWLNQIGVDRNISFSHRIPALKSHSVTSIFPNRQIRPPEVRDFSSLAIASQAKLVVGTQNSAMMWQSLALGFPTLMTGFGPHKFFEFPINGIWKCHDPDFDSFSTSALRLWNHVDHRLSDSELLPTRHAIRHSRFDTMLGLLRDLVESASRDEVWDY